VSIVNDLYAIVEWSWGEGGGQDIFVNQGNATSPSWKYVGGGGGRIDAAGLQRSYNVPPPYNVPLVSNVLNCAARNLQPIVSGMSKHWNRLLPVRGSANANADQVAGASR